MWSRVRGFLVWTISLLLLLGLAAAAYWTHPTWLPLAKQWVQLNQDSHGHDHPSDADHGHDHGESPFERRRREREKNRLHLSPQAQRNLGLVVEPLTRQPYWETMTVPAQVIERPGHSHRKIVAPFTAVVKKIHVLPSQALSPGDPMVELRLMDEMLANHQSALLQTLEQIEVEQMRLARIRDSVAEGILPEKQQLEIEYRIKNLQRTRHVQAQELLVRGLTEEQVDQIVSEKQLIRSVTLSVPEPSAHERQHMIAHKQAPSTEPLQRVSYHHEPHSEASAYDADTWTYLLEDLAAYPGRMVQPGDELCHLALHSTLYLEGRAYEEELTRIVHALQQAWPVTAEFEFSGRDGQPVRRTGLQILFVGNEVDADSRTFGFYVALRNEVLHRGPGMHGEEYLTWQFKPGQKLQLHVPIAQAQSEFVVPRDAIVRDGAQVFVFVQDAAEPDHFLPEAVEVLREDSKRKLAVIRGDEHLQPGTPIAMNNAYQLLLAFQKKQGGGGGHHHHDH